MEGVGTGLSALPRSCKLDKALSMIGLSLTPAVGAGETSQARADFLHDSLSELGPVLRHKAINAPGAGPADWGARRGCPAGFGRGPDAWRDVRMSDRHRIRAMSR